MDGISAYNNISHSYQNPASRSRQQPLDEARPEKGNTPASQDTENHSEKPSSIQDKVTLSAEAQEKLRELSVRDQEVRTHEAAHAAVGGRYAGAPKLSYEQGPDGRRYAVEGKVNIDTSEVPGDPQQTLAKADIIKKAALAPQNPSAADRAIAAEATQMAAKARMERSAEQNEGLQRGLKRAISSEEGAQAVSPYNDEPGTQQPQFKIRGQLLNIRT